MPGRMTAGRWVFKRSLIVRVAVIYAITRGPAGAADWIGERFGVADELLDAGLITADDIEACSK